MRTRSVFLSMVVIGLTAPAAEAAPRLCDNRPGVTVAATSVVRVFRDKDVLRGCRHGSRRTLRLATATSCEGGGIGPLAAAGRYVAVTRISCEEAAETATVVLYDLRLLRDLLGATAFSGDAPELRSVRVAELALTRAGALAWVGRMDSTSASRAELHLRRPGSSVPELIDAGEGGGLSDIALTTSRLYWLRDGSAQVTVL